MHFTLLNWWIQIMIIIYLLKRSSWSMSWFIILRGPTLQFLWTLQQLDCSSLRRVQTCDFSSERSRNIDFVLIPDKRERQKVCSRRTFPAVWPPPDGGESSLSVRKIINCAFMPPPHNTNKAATLLWITWKMSARTPGMASGRRGGPLWATTARSNQD